MICKNHAPSIPEGSLEESKPVMISIWNWKICKLNTKLKVAVAIVEAVYVQREHCQSVVAAARGLASCWL